MVNWIVDFQGLNFPDNYQYSLEEIECCEWKFIINQEDSPHSNVFPFLKAISKCSLKKSLKSINFEAWEVSESVVGKEAKDLGLVHIDILVI